MKDKEQKLEEIEVSHTLGGVGEGRNVVCRGEASRGGVDATLLSDTVEDINLAEVGIGLVGLRGPMHLCACVSKGMGTGRVRARKRYLCWQIHFDTSISPR